MFDAFSKVAQKRAERKRAREEAKKNHRKPDMLDPKNYEEPMGLYELLKKKKEIEEEEEEEIE